MAVAQSYGKKKSFKILRQSLNFVPLRAQNAMDDKWGAGIPPLPSRASRKMSKRNEIPEGTGHKKYLDIWVKAMRHGLIGGRPYAESTAEKYLTHANLFLDKYNEVSIENIRNELLSIPPEQFATKFEWYKALVSFSKILVEEGALPEDFLDVLRRKRLNPSDILLQNKLQLLQKLYNPCRGPADTCIDSDTRRNRT